MTIKAIGFDQGGVIIDVDYHKGIEAFEKLGATNMHEVYTQVEQTDYIDHFEQGKITAAEFRSILRKNLKGLPPDTTDAEIDSAWNAMVLGCNKERLAVAAELKTAGFITFAFSNINELHYGELVSLCHHAGVTKSYSQAFHEKYFSHLFGHNKPYAESFRVLAQDLHNKYNIQPHEILSIDDSPKHIYGRDGHEDEGAICAGWQGLVVQQNLPGDEFRNIVHQKLSL